MISRRALFWIFFVALGVRAGFVLWAPGELTGDQIWHAARAVGLAQGQGYVDPDGSPSIDWMPGWSLFLAGLFAPFGPHLWLGFGANVLLGAATSAMVAAWGARLVSPRVGIAAGVLYAAWPGNVYYAATLMSETFFNFLLVACLLVLTRATAPDCRRPARGIAGAGALLGAMALVKAEPLILTPLLLAVTTLGPWGPRRAARLGALLVLAAGLVLSPWVVRNYVHWGRILVTSGTGPANAWLGHHEGASGGQSMATAMRQARYLRENPEESGYRLAWEFARNHPREELLLAWKKLVLTYGSDDDAVTLIRGVRPRQRRFVSLPAEQRLRSVANTWWTAVMLLAAVGLVALRGLPARAWLLVLGVPACWLVVHLLFIGGARFHVPETPSIALLAGAGLFVLRDAVRRLRARPGSPPGPRPDPAPPDASPGPEPPRA